MKRSGDGLLARGLLMVGVVLAAALCARAFDTSWIKDGSPVSAMSLKADLDEIERRLGGFELFGAGSESEYTAPAAYPAAMRTTTEALVLPRPGLGAPLRKRFLRTAAADANPRRLVLFYKSRDTANWEASQPIEIIVRTSYYQPSWTRSIFTSGYNDTNQGQPRLTVLESAGARPIVPSLAGREVTVLGTIVYQQVVVDVPAYAMVTVELTYGDEEVASYNALNGAGQISIDGSELPGAGAGAFYGGPPWTGLAYAANYADYGVAGWQTGQWMKDGQGFIHVRGLVKKSAAWAAGDIIATLPAGARPSAAEGFLCTATDSSAGSFVARVEVSPSGALQLWPTVGAPAAPANLGWLELGNIMFHQAN